MLFKILGKVFIVFIGIILLMIIVFAWFSSANSRKCGDHEKILKSNREGYKKALVVYQPSRGSITSKIAESISKGIHDEGYEVTINYPGKHMPQDISKYSIVVFGSPVYMGQTSSTLSSYIKSIKDFSNSKILIFATGAQLNNGEVDNMEKQLRNKKADIKAGFKSGEEDISKAYELGKQIAGE